MKWTIIFFLLFSISCTQNDPKFGDLRKLMIKNQLRSRGISNEGVLKVMHSVERHKFVPENYQDRAYSDGPLPIGYGQTISQPYIVAYMTEQLQVSSQHKFWRLVQVQDTRQQYWGNWQNMCSPLKLYRNWLKERKISSIIWDIII